MNMVLRHAMAVQVPKPLPVEASFIEKADSSRKALNGLTVIKTALEIAKQISGDDAAHQKMVKQ